MFDDIGFGSAAVKLRAQGKAVVGGTPYTDQLEDDRDFGQQEMKAAGVAILPSSDFTTFDEAIAFVGRNPGRYVVKPSGKAQSEKVLSFVGQEEDGKDVLNILEHYKRSWASKIKSFQLQKYVSGVEVAVGGFFNGTDFVMPVCINFEHKRMFNDTVGIRLARNQDPILVQTYVRDTGEVLNDLSVPITVRGRHWGAVRLGFSPDMLMQKSSQ